MTTRMSDDGTMVGAVVVVSLHSPKERVWGLMMNLNMAGITLQAIDLSAFEDFVRQARDPEQGPVGLPTVFYPMQRVERIALDEERAGIPSMAQRFEQQVGISLEEHLESARSDG